MPAAALIAVDWGTSSLRTALLADDGQVLEERSAARGILTVAPDEFAAVLQSQCSGWPDATRVPRLVSGMAGSRQGWREAPYCPCPATLADLAAQVLEIEPRGMPSCRA